VVRAPSRVHWFFTERTLAGHIVAAPESSDAPGRRDAFPGGAEVGFPIGTASDTRRFDDVTVITVDDHVVFRRVAQEVVAATRGFRLVGEAESGETALPLVAELQPDMVLLDVRMPGMGGIETARLITSEPAPPVVVLVTVEGLQAVPEDAVSCGAACVARKQDFSPAMLRRLWKTYGSPRASRSPALGVSGGLQ
jgi:two-component system, NarL family, invasion response regulator UvrY